MAELQARTLYAFTGDTEGGELSFDELEMLTVVRQDIGDGWWEARNGKGEHGLIPESYVQILSLPEPSFPPPTPPPPSAPSINEILSNRNANHATEKQASFDDWDDDWDDDDYGDDASSSGTTQQNDYYENNNDSYSMQSHEFRNSTHPSGDLSKYGTVKKSYNRFSLFSRQGGEAFLMGQLTGSVSETDTIQITNSPDGPLWIPKAEYYTCQITSPKKTSKLKGLKSFIAYTLKPSFGVAVSRRYKHFDWLHERLEEKFVCIPIPPLPEKAISGRYEEDFINERMRRLQQWVNRMVRHPVISHCEVFLHFLTCTDEKKWKVGKRKAEKDEFMGGKFFITLQIPQQCLDMKDIDSKMETFVKFLRNMDDNVKHLCAVFHDNMKKHVGPFRREYQRIGLAFKNLAVTFMLETGAFSTNLTTAINNTGDTYNKIGEMFSKQPPKDIVPLLEAIYEYKGILSTFPDVMKVHEGATGKAKDCLKQQEERKMTESEIQSIMQRADVISYATIAEIGHFHYERCKDFKVMMQNYLREQIDFYKQITQKLEDSLKMYEAA